MGAALVALLVAHEPAPGGAVFGAKTSHVGRLPPKSGAPVVRIGAETSDVRRLSAKSGAPPAPALLAQIDLFGGDDEAPPPVETPKPKPKPDDTPLVIPPADGPVPDGVPKAEDAPPPKPPKPRPPDEQRRDLQVERQHLLDTRPSYTVPTVVTAFAALALVIGASLGLTGLRGALDGHPGNPFLIGAPLGIVGLGVFVFGLIWERERYLQREPFDERIEEIEKELGW